MKLRWLALVALALLLTGCAGENPLVGTVGKSGVAGFWAGLWHGFICPIAFVLSLFNAHVTMYEVHNNGGWYNAGFILGAGAWGMLRGRTPRPSLKQFSDDSIREEAGKRRIL